MNATITQGSHLPQSTTKRIEVFRPGTFTPMVGKPIAFTAADLAALAEGYDAANAPAPVVVGHPKTDAPAYGWATRFVYDDTAQKLFAEVGDLQPAFADAVKAKAYRKISLSLFPPDAANNPKPGSWYPKHIGFLGAAAPAVPGLAPVEMAGDEEALTFEFGEAAFLDVSMLFRGLRDWLIEKHGREEADKVLPDYAINWIERAAREDDDKSGMLPAYSETPMSKEQEASFAEREQQLAQREAELKAREEEITKQARAARHVTHVAFAEGLANEGKLLPAMIANVAGLLDALAETDAAVSFAEGDATADITPAEALKKILAGAPPIVEFGEHDKGKAPGDAPAIDFAAPQGVRVDAEGLAMLAKVEAWRKEHPDASFAEAVKACGGN